MNNTLQHFIKKSIHCKMETFTKDKVVNYLRQIVVSFSFFFLLRFTMVKF